MSHEEMHPIACSCSKCLRAHAQHCKAMEEVEQMLAEPLLERCEHGKDKAFGCSACIWNESQLRNRAEKAESRIKELERQVEAYADAAFTARKLLDEALTKLHGASGPADLRTEPCGARTRLRYGSVIVCKLPKGHWKG